MALNWPAWQRVANDLRAHLEKNPDDKSFRMTPEEISKFMKAFNENGVEMAGMPKDGTFYAAQTLLGCGFGNDRNIRHVYCWPSDVPVLVMNERMGEWTPEDQSRLDIVLKALNDGEKK